MKRCLFIMCLILTGSGRLYCDILVSIDNSVSLSSEDTSALTASIGISALLDACVLLDQSWGLFLNGGGYFYYLPADTSVQYSLDLTGEVSLRRDDFLARLACSGIFQGYNLEMDLQLLPQLFITYDLDNASLSTRHSILIDLLMESKIGYQGMVGLSFMVSPVSITDLKISAGITPSNIGSDINTGGSVAFSWYPGVTTIIEGEIGAEYMFAEYPYITIDTETEFTWSLHRTVQFLFDLTGLCVLYTDGSSRTLGIRPKVSFDFSLGEKFFLTLSTGGDILFDLLTGSGGYIINAALSGNIKL